MEAIDVATAFSDFIMSSSLIPSPLTSAASSPTENSPSEPKKARRARRASEPRTPAAPYAKVKAEPMTPLGEDSSPTGQVEGVEGDRRIKRVMRNRASAVASRQRRKDRVVELNEQIAAAQREYAEHTLQTARLQAERDALEKELMEVRKMIADNPFLSRVLAGVLQVAAAMLSQKVALAAIAAAPSVAGRSAAPGAPAAACLERCY